MRHLASTLLLLAVAAVAAGCGERSEPLGELRQAYPVTARGADDQPTVVRRAPERIVALDSGAAELLQTLGAGSRLVGAPAELIDGATAVVRPTGQILVDAVADLRPDLIVATPSTDRVEVSRAERETGAAVYVQPSASIEDVERATLELGFLIDEPVAARKVVGEMRRETRAIDERISAAAPVTVFIDTGFFITVPERSLLGELVRRSGGTNVAGNEAGLGPFDLQQLARLDPDVYLATSDSRTTLQTLRRNPRTRGLTAVEEGRFAVLDVALVTRAGPRIAQAYEAVAAALHPDAFR